MAKAHNEPGVLETSGSGVFTVGTKVWLKDEQQSWVRGEVLKVAGSELLVQVTNGREVRVKQSDCCLQNVDEEVEVGTAR